MHGRSFTEDERKQHPIFGKMSLSTFAHFFTKGNLTPPYYVSEDDMELLELPADELRYIIEGIEDESLSQKYPDKRFVLFCMSVGVGGSLLRDDLNFRSVADRFKLSINDIAFLYAALGISDKWTTLLTGAGTDLDAVLSDNNFEAILIAIKKGGEAFTTLTLLAPQTIDDLIKSNVFSDALTDMAIDGNLEVLQFFAKKEKIPSELLPHLYKIAAKYNNINILRYLDSHFPDLAEKAATATDFKILKDITLSFRRQDVVKYLLSHPIYFKYAEEHPEECSHLIIPFVSAKLRELQSKKPVSKDENPDNIHYLKDDDRKQLCFYMLKFLIKRNNGVADDLRFLLSLPEIHALAHADVDSGEFNVLLRLAKKVNNPLAATILLEIPAVAAQAKEDNYYAGEEGQLNLRAIVERPKPSASPVIEHDDTAEKKEYEKLEKMAEQELREFIKEQFKTKITDANRQQISDALNDYHHSRNLAKAIPILKQLDITPEEQTRFKQELAEKYDKKFKRKVDNYIDNRLRLPESRPGEPPGRNAAHAVWFGAGLAELLKPTRAAASTTAEPVPATEPKTPVKAKKTRAAPPASKRREHYRLHKKPEPPQPTLPEKKARIDESDRNALITDLDREIKRLKKSTKAFRSSAKPKIAAFENLKSQIKSADSVPKLHESITQWEAEFGDVIKKSRTKPTLFSSGKVTSDRAFNNLKQYVDFLVSKIPKQKK